MIRPLFNIAKRMFGKPFKASEGINILPMPTNSDMLIISKLSSLNPTDMYSFKASPIIFAKATNTVAYPTGTGREEKKIVTTGKKLINIINPLPNIKGFFSFISVVSINAAEEDTGTKPTVEKIPAII